jgi:serine/threonine-protein kinase
MSPEQLTSTASADERADIWSLGTILYELLAGAPAFDGDAGPQVCVNVMQLAPAPMSSRRGDLPDSLEATILLCLEKDPSRRFGNVGELAMALAAFGTPETAHASADRTVRVLKAAGIIPTSLRGGLFTVEPMQEAAAQAPASRRASIAPRAPREAAEVAGAVDVPMPVPEFHFHRRRSGLVAAIALLACAGLGAALCFYWWQDAGPTRTAEVHVVPIAPRAATPGTALPEAPPAAQAAAAWAAPLPARPAAPADTVAIAAQQGDPTRPPVPATKHAPRAWRHVATSQRPAAPAPTFRGPDPSIAAGYTGAPPALPPDVSPYDAPTTAPTPTATPTTIATATALPAPPASPDQLFDERK